MDAHAPPRDPKGLRTGFTTGACAAAAAKAATRCLVQNVMLTEIETTLPNRARVTFPLLRCERLGPRMLCSVRKDAGDDPDCTHDAELIAEVELCAEPGVQLSGGPGVATVTKPGLGLEVGGPAINPVPRRNITEMVNEELARGDVAGARVTISVPRGEQMAEKTTNARLGLLGGISILGTTGIVRPYSTAAFKASVKQEIDVAATSGAAELVLTTGGRSEQYAMALHPHLPPYAFVQVGDFIGIALRQCARRGIERAVIVGMIGKLSKMAAGRMQTHAAGSEVDMDFLATLASESGASEQLATAIRAANTARHVLELCRDGGLPEISARVCERVVQQCSAHAGGELAVHAYMVDFGGALLGQHTEAPPRSAGAVPPTEVTR